jgi:hypothetical protein
MIADDGLIMHIAVTVKWHVEAQEDRKVRLKVS